MSGLSPSVIQICRRNTVKLAVNYCMANYDSAVTFSAKSLNYDVTKYDTAGTC